MALRAIELQTADEIQLFLVGGVAGGKSLSNQTGRIQNLHGKTLIIGSSTITFDESAGSAGQGGGLTVKEICQQISAVVTTMTPGLIGGRLSIRETTPSSGVTVDKDGTANPLLGFSSSKDSVGIVINAPGVGAPEFVGITTKFAADGYLLIVNEA